ncbi:FxsA family protein [Priestia megaterium]
MSQGHVPSGEILDGMCVLFGGLFLLFPGFLTDVVGFIFYCRLHAESLSLFF